MYSFHVIDLSPSRMESSLGILTFKKMPRPGDWVEIELERGIFTYRVAQIVHELVADETGSVGEDVLYIADPRRSADAQLELYKAFRTPERD